MQLLPTGMQSFEIIRKKNYLYIDKTEKLLQLAKTDNSYFLSRPRRFGKSLTISTLEAMFQGKAELFKGLYAEEWVKEQANHPNPVITLDMSGLDSYENIKEIDESLISDLQHIANEYKINIDKERNAKAMFKKLIYTFYEKFGSVVVLIDEYDFPITEYIDNIKMADKVRKFLRNFYITLKTYTKYLRFVFITGISKFTKVGIFSGLNNLNDISMSEKYGDVLGYTQKELEDNFSEWIEITAQKKSINKQKLLEKIKEYYDGFSFDGITRVYNPFSVLNFFDEGNFYNYWYNSSTPSFLAKYLKDHKIKDSDEYRHLKVSSNFTNTNEIEHASPESFLFQSGYLTIEKWDEDKNEITLDYPNEEVRDSLPNLYLYNIYNINDYVQLANDILTYLKNGDMMNVMLIFNRILARIPYEDFANDNINKKTIESLNEEQKKAFKKIIYSKKEKWYRSLFIMLLSVVKVQIYPEVHTNTGRPDIVIPFDDKTIIIEFKLAPTSKDVKAKKKEGEEQIKKYISAYIDTSSLMNEREKKIITAVFVADDKKRQIVV